MNELKARSQNEYIGKTFTAISAVYLHDDDLAHEYLEAAYLDHDPVLLLLKYADWVPPSLRKDPRFISLMQRIGQP